MRKITLLLILGLFVFVGAVAAQEVSYTVQPGDNLTIIANEFEVEMDAILQRNNIIDPNRIKRGQTLVIPVGAVSVPLTHLVKHGESLNDVAIRYNTTEEALLEINEIVDKNNLIVGQVLTLPAQGGPATFPRRYVIDIGDTLRSIGERFGVTWQALAVYNEIQDPNLIFASGAIAIPPMDYVPEEPAVGGPETDAPATSEVTEAVPVPVTLPPQPSTYVVQQGDVLELIAERFGTTVEAIRQANDLTPTTVFFPGDVFIIPATGGPVVTQPVASPPQAVGNIYTIRAGDTMFSIAAGLNVNLYDLAQANGILNLNSIFAGQQLIVPGL